jgi:abhydrolase domain-containing protein 14
LIRRLAALAIVVALVASLAGCGSDEREPAENTTTIETGGVEVNAIVRPPSRPGPGEPSGKVVTVLFLHGQSYDSYIWDDTDILNAVSAAGWRAVAVDLPGYGRTDDRPDDVGGKPLSDGAWLRGLIDEIGGPETVVVVSPSMSGRYSLSYLEEFPDEQLLGFVPVAPVGIDDFERPKDAAGITTTAIWGSKDPSYTKARAKHLTTEMRAAAGLATTEVIEGAGHAAYEDDPKAFTSILIGFLGTLDPQAP